VGPVLLGAARDVTGDFETSVVILVAVALALVAACGALSPDRLHRGVLREAVPGPT
jgi:cyanate permease